MSMAEVVGIHSTDILFPEEDCQPAHTLAQESFYSPPSTYSSYSTYSTELHHFFDSSDQTVPQTYRDPSGSRGGSRGSKTYSRQSYSSQQSYNSGQQRRLSHTERSNSYTAYPASNPDYLNTSTGSSNNLSDRQDYSEVNTLTKRQGAHFSTPEANFINADQQYDNPNQFYANKGINYHNHGRSRRRTWSPQSEDAMGTTSSFHHPKIRSYHSNNQLDAIDGHNDHIYESLPEYPAQPPKITPYSGILRQVPGKVVIRPLAFKPVVPSSNRYVTSPHQLPRDTKAPSQAGSQDDGYGSHDYTTSTHSNVSQNSFHMDSDRSASYGSSEGPRLCDRPGSYSSSNVSRISSNHMESYPHQTPSPSDSGVGELEVMLREKDAEIGQLRDLMEQNERIIFQVYEEKQLSWHMEMKDLKLEYQKRLKIHQQRMFKMEQSLMLQVYKLQQEKKKTDGELEKLRKEKDECEKTASDYETQLKLLESDQSSYKRELSQKSSEISLLKQQLKEAKEDTGSKINETSTLKAQLKDLQSELDHKTKVIDQLKDDLTESQMELQGVKADYETLKKESKKDTREGIAQTENIGPDMEHIERERSSSVAELERLNAELQRAKQEVEKQKEEMVKEKHNWFVEKDKVVRYQKQLQLNYVQMFRKNRMLEAEIEQLTIELESRDLKLLHSNDESLC